MNKLTPVSSSKLTASHWGVGVVELDENDLVNVKPHTQDDDPSRINENYRDGISGSGRVRRPAVRQGYLEQKPLSASKVRGSERFVEVSWDTALELISGALKKTIARYGNEAIFGGSYGWASAGRFHHAQSQLKRFLNCAGGFVRSEGNYSYNAALVLMPYIVGNFRHHVKQATRWSTVAKHGELVVMFGGVPIRSGQVGGGGMARHRLREQLIECKQAGVEFVNLSPLRSDAYGALDAQWLPPRPGSDTAIMMGIAHTLLEEDLHDIDFLNRYTVGFEKAADYLLGKQDGVIKNVDWASQQSGIDAKTLRQLARKMAKSRTLICTAVSLQRAESGEQPLWMTVTLASMLGQIGLPGGGYGIGYGADASIGTTDRPLPWPSFPQGDNPVENYIPVATIADMLLHPGEAYAYNGTQMTYPDIKLMWWAGGNPFHHHQDLNRLVKAFQKPETIIVNEIGWTATARHADIVLPVTSTLERTDFGAGSQDTALIPMPKAIEPAGEARDEYDIFCALADKLGFKQTFTKGRTSSEWLDAMWLDMRHTAKQAGCELPVFSEFLQGDIVEFDDPAPEHVFLADFRKDPLGHTLPTASGRIELYSKQIDSYGYQDCPGQATWLPPTDWLGGSAVKQFPIHLISGQPATRLHSQLDQGSFSKSRKIQGREPVLIHPNDAISRDVKNGDVVKLFNERGSCLAAAVITDEIRENVVFLWTGAWFDPDLRDSGNPIPLEKHGNPNVLTHDKRTSSLSQGPAAHSALIEIEKFDQTLPPITAFKPPV